MQTQAYRSPSELEYSLETLVADQRSLLQSLSQDLHSLQQQVATLSAEVRQQSTLGFGNGRDYIIIERDKNILWHRFENDEPVPIKAKVLKGYIKQVVYVDKEYPKLHVFIEGDREYVLVTGFETHFSRELLAAIATLTPEALTHPVIIKPDVGEGESKHKPVFCNVIHQGRTIKPGTLRNMDIQQLFQRAEAVLRGDAPEAIKAPRESREPITDRQPISSGQPYGQASPAAIMQLAPAAVDWKKVCHDLHITPQDLKAVAWSLNLPEGKLTRSQTGQLYQAVYQRYQATG
jgi:hypothetical protein